MKKNGWWLLILGIIGGGLLAGGIQWRPAQAAGPNQVGLVISFGDGTVKNQCISFSNEKITGLEVLQAAGLPLEVDYSSVGAAVCKIGNVGCPADNCFCDSPPNFWSYWHLKDRNWAFSQLGAGSYNVSSGSVEGWNWGTGQSNPPPLASFDQICALQAVPTETPTPTSTAVPTLAPTATPTKTSTTAPTLAPTQAFTPTPRPANTATLIPAPTGTPEQSAELSASSGTPAQIYLPLISRMEAPVQEAPSPTAIAASSTPTAIAQVSEVDTPTPALPQPTPTSSMAEVAPAAGSNPTIDWGSYLPLGVIVLGLGAGLFVVAHKKWK